MVHEKTSPRPGTPYDKPHKALITLEELDRLQAVYDASTQTHAGYCKANSDDPDGCPCGTLWMTPNEGYGTYRDEDVRVLTDPKTEKLCMVVDSRGALTTRDIKAFVEAKNALPGLIQLARKALQREILDAERAAERDEER